MELLDRMNVVIDYIEKNITDELEIGTLAQLACCSSFNFQRMFSFVTDMSVTEYIRRRRLSLAALELQESHMPERDRIKIIDLALKYRYESPISFARAFQTVHGVSPSEARKSNISLKMFPRMTFQIIIKGTDEMNYRIVKTEPFKVFGIEGIVSTSDEPGYFSHVGEIWQENHRNGKYEQLFLDAGQEKLPIYDTMFVNEMCRIHGLMNYRKINDTTYGYMQCSFVTPESRTDGYTVFEIPAATWVVFPSELIGWDVGSAMETLNKRFYTEWLPASEYEKADAPEFEMYGGTPEKGYIELWIPITNTGGDSL